MAATGVSWSKRPPITLIMTAYKPDVKELGVSLGEASHRVKDYSERT
jgi:hypothetical protein